MYLGSNASHEEILKYGDSEQIKKGYDSLLETVQRLKAEIESLENECGRLAERIEEARDALR